MFKPTVTLERFLSLLMPGTILVGGIWYFNRAFLMVYFPAIASDSGGQGQVETALGAKALVFLIAATVAGLIVNLMSDIVIVGIANDAAASTKSRRLLRRVFRLAFRLFVLRPDSDPRVRAIGRYLRSPREKMFLAMMRDWVQAEKSELETPTGAISAHQHLVARMRALSDRSATVLNDLYQRVEYAASLCLSLILLVPVAIIAFWSNRVASVAIPAHGPETLWRLLFIVYIGGVCASYITKRRFRHFCSQIVTTALHFYECSQDVRGSQGVNIKPER